MWDHSSVWVRMRWVLESSSRVRRELIVLVGDDEDDEEGEEAEEEEEDKGLGRK